MLIDRGPRRRPAPILPGDFLARRTAPCGTRAAVVIVLPGGLARVQLEPFPVAPGDPVEAVGDFPSLRAAVVAVLDWRPATEPAPIGVTPLRLRFGHGRASTS